MDSSRCCSRCFAIHPQRIVINHANLSNALVNGRSYRILKICGTPLEGLCYWQIKCTLSGDPKVPELNGFICEMGIASKVAFEGSGTEFTPSTKNACSVHLIMKESSLKVMSYHEDMVLDEMDVGQLNPSHPVEKTFGFLLDRDTGRFVAAEVGRMMKLFDVTVDISSPLHPVLIGGIVDVPSCPLLSLTVESGSELQRTAALVQLLEVMDKGVVEMEELSDE